MEDTGVPNNLIPVVKENFEAKNEGNKKDSLHDFLCQRIQKLTTAIYLVTGLLSSDDPLRQSIRKASVGILSFINSPTYAVSLKDSAEKIVRQCKKITSLLEVAFFSGYVSEMNYSVLKSEFDAFTQEVKDYHDLALGITSLSQTNFQVSQIEAKKEDLPLIHKGHSSSVKDKTFSSQMISQQGRNVDVKRSSRRESILSIIRKKGKVTVKDISQVVIGCSEKTIQRELLSLVEKGVLKKEGERRWSSYSFT